MSSGPGGAAAGRSSRLAACRERSRLSPFSRLGSGKDPSEISVPLIAKHYGDGGRQRTSSDDFPLMNAADRLRQDTQCVYRLESRCDLSVFSVAVDRRSWLQRGPGAGICLRALQTMSTGTAFASCSDGDSHNARSSSGRSPGRSLWSGVGDHANLADQQCWLAAHMVQQSAVEMGGVAESRIEGCRAQRCARHSREHRPIQPQKA